MRRGIAKICGLLLIIGAVLTASVCAVDAQPQPAKMVRIGVLANHPWPPIDGLREGLRKLGYVEGQNLKLEYRWAEGRTDRYLALAKELVGLHVDAIVTTGTPAVLAAQRATRIIPIVMASAGDPVGNGVVASLAHPGGNVTGLSSFTAEVEEKRLELLKDLLPRLSRVAALWNPTNPFNSIAVQHARSAADALGVRVDLVGASTASELDNALLALSQTDVEAVLVIGDAFLLEQAPRIIDFMARARLPATYLYRELAEAGGLIAYATNFYDLFHRAATYVDKILKGGNPGELPVEQPTKFELIINLKTAEMLGLTIPSTLLARADRVIE
jgi:putative ABC transport system substrate-binding protein